MLFQFPLCSIRSARYFITFAWFGYLIALTTWLTPSTRAEHYAIRRYGISDGLANNRVNCIHQDAKGYMWFGTWEGLSRFDGYRFVNYVSSDGLANSLINDIAEDRNGRLWVATQGGGIARLIDDPYESSANQSPTQTARSSSRQKLISYKVGASNLANTVGRLAFDQQNLLWCVTDAGLHRAITGSNNTQFELVQPSDKMIDNLICDHLGRLWFNNFGKLTQEFNGQTVEYGPPAAATGEPIRYIVEDRQGGLLVAFVHSIFEFVPVPEGGKDQWQPVPFILPAGHELWPALLVSSGATWIGTNDGLFEYQRGRQVRMLTTAQGLSDNGILSLHEDSEGNLWIGTSNGVCKYSGETIVSFNAQGMPGQDFSRIIESSSGRVYASASYGGIVEIVNENGIVVPGSQRPPFNAISKRIIQDRRGDWWLGTDKGLYFAAGPELRFDRVRKLTAAEGIAETPIFMGPGLYEDRDGRIWASTLDNLYFFDPAKDTRPHFQTARVKPPLEETPLALQRDSAGVLWLATFSGTWRWPRNGSDLAQLPRSLPESDSRSFFQDSRGWFWLGLRFKGASVLMNPASDQTNFKNFSTQDGLLSDAVWSITEDDLGRMYLANGRGLDQLDFSEGVEPRIRHFTRADGLAGDTIWHCLKDSRGDIWLATSGGVSRLDPRAQGVPNNALPVYFSRVQAAGESLALQETGAAHLPATELSPSQNNLLIDFVAPNFRAEHAVKYQFQLQPVDHDWSAPSEQRSVNYARLAPGKYRFLVRAINQEGIVSIEPASLEFRVLAPIYERWWSIAIATLLVAVSTYLLYRRRLARLVELERVRTRIATDLHDDIGASLSLIAMLSEVARRQARNGDAKLNEALSSIAGSSRELVDSMSDIVWAVNPRKDRLSELVKRMRRFASDVFSSRNIELTFDAPENEHDVKLGADERREIFFILKEGVNNVARHSGCSEARITLSASGGNIELELIDNGNGFDPEHAEEGNGLASMRERARKLSGELDIVSGIGKGTTLRLRVPLSRRLWKV